MVDFRGTFPGIPESVAAIRREVCAAARSCGLDGERLGHVRLAVSEAASNAIVHAYGERPGEIVVEARREGDDFVVTVCDHGEGLLPKPDSPGLGLGLPLIVALTKRMEICDEDGATEVVMAFDCPDADGERR